MPWGLAGQQQQDPNGLWRKGAPQAPGGGAQGAPAGQTNPWQQVHQQPGGFTNSFPPAGGAPAGGAAPAGGPGGTSLLGDYPGLNPGTFNINSAYPEQPRLPYGNQNLNQQTINRNFEASQSGPSATQMLDKMRPDSSGLLRTAGDSAKIASPLAQRAGQGADAITGTVYGQATGNADTMLQNQLGRSLDISGQSGNLEKLANSQRDYNLQSLLSGLNLQYGQQAGKTGILQSLLGGVLGGAGGMLG
jgi:hypothetical protein